jgi:DNA replication protein DnaC
MTSQETPEIKYEKCEFCGKERPRKRVTPANARFAIYGDVELCDCLQAVAERKEWAELDSRRREQERQEEHIRIVDLLRQECQLPARYQPATFEAAKRTNSNQAAYDRALTYCKDFARKTTTKGLFITGPASTGKTYLAGCIVNALVDKGVGCLFGNVLDHLGSIRKTYDGENKETEDHAVQQLAKVHVLVIDDLGKEKVKEWTEQMLYRVINMRYEQLKPLIVTSNFNLTELEKRYPDTGPYIVSRLVEMCDGLKMAGDDWRKKPAR